MFHRLLSKRVAGGGCACLAFYFCTLVQKLLKVRGVSLSGSYPTLPSVVFDERDRG